MIELTKREQQILTFIQGAINEKGYPPSVREIGKAVALSSTSTVHAYLERLKNKGYLRRDSSMPRAIVLCKQPDIIAIPVLGRIAAGAPAFALENREGFVNLPLELVGHGDFFALRVSGDSMINAGIYEGDIVIVRKQPTAESGDIVAALVGEEATVKRFYKENSYIRLQPENKTMRPIRVKEATILGRVVSLIRKY